MQIDLPWFPLYVNDFASDGKVEAMTTEEVGAYFLLLCKAWKEKPVGSIPNDDAILARWSRLNADRWALCKPRVLDCFMPLTDNRLHQKRMQRIYREIVEARSKRSRAGRLGAERRWGDGNANGNAIDLPLPTQCDPECDSESKTKNPKRKTLFVPPSLEEVQSYCSERGNRVSAEQFVDYYTANGWVQGRQGKPLRDWKAAVRTWERNGFHAGGSTNGRAGNHLGSVSRVGATQQQLDAIAAKTQRIGDPAAGD